MGLQIRNGYAHPYAPEVDPRDIDRHVKLDLVDELEQAGYVQGDLHPVIGEGAGVVCTCSWLLEKIGRNNGLLDGEVVGPYEENDGGRKRCPPLAIAIWRKGDAV